MAEYQPDRDDSEHSKRTCSRVRTRHLSGISQAKQSARDDLLARGRGCRDRGIPISGKAEFVKVGPSLADGGQQVAG